jgi:hypothetical protein
MTFFFVMIGWHIYFIAVRFFVKSGPLVSWRLRGRIKGAAVHPLSPEIGQRVTMKQNASLTN